MVELSISEFEFKAGVTKGRSEDLATVVAKCERELKKRTANEKEKHSNLMNNLLGTYFSLETKLNFSNIFDKEGKQKNNIIRHYSLYSASKAILNQLYDGKIGSMHELDRRAPTFSYDEINDKSSFSLLKSILNKLEENIRTNHSYPKYTLYQFFDNVKRYCKLQIRGMTDDYETLDNIKVTKEGLDFTEIVANQNKANGNNSSTAKSELNKYVPEEIPEYIPTKPVYFKDCIGNVEKIEEILNSIFMAFRYDPATGKNEFSKIGSGFQNNFLIYGKEGVGKTMAVDAVVHWAREMAKEIGKPLLITDMSSAIKTCLVDISGKILEEFYKKEEQGNEICINIFDENAGGKFYNSNKDNSNNEDRKSLETAKKMFGRKYKKIINIIVTNYTDENSLESAFKQRFGKKIKLEGPQTAEQFSQVLQYELRDMIKLGIVDPSTNWLEMGQLFAQYKTLEQPGFSVTGRSVEQACKNLNGVGKLYKQKHLLDNNKVPTRQFYHEYRKLHQKITPGVLHKSITKYLDDELSAAGYRIDNHVSMTRVGEEEIPVVGED